MPRYDQYPALSDVSVDDKIVVLDASTGQNKLVSQRDLVGISDFGWTATGEDWTYSSYSTTTKLAVITVPSGATTKYSVGMAVRFAQPTDGTKYGRIRSVTSTTLTVYMAASYDLDNEAITDPVYTSTLAPQGMPETDRVINDNKLDYPRWWQELGRTTLSSTSATITVSSLPARKYLHIRYAVIATGGTVTNVQIQLNNDTANNYSRRTSTDGTADATATNSNVFMNASSVPTGALQTGVIDVLNLATAEKIGSIQVAGTNGSGAGVVPSRNETTTKWVNTADQINRVDLIASAASFAAGSEIIILGHD